MLLVLDISTRWEISQINQLGGKYTSTRRLQQGQLHQRPKAFQAPIDIMAAPPVLVGEDVAPAAVPEPDDDVVVMPAADELADEEPEAELDTLEDDPVDMADNTVIPDPPVVAMVAVAAARPGE